MTCEDYLEDPEGNASHLASCSICAALEEEVEVRHQPMSVDALPLAPWEGAKYRTWPLVGAGLLAVFTLAIVLSAAAEVSPLTAVTASMPSVKALLTFFQLTGRAMGAPVVAVLFVVINTVLFLLLRRAPKGADV
ncbi:MAG: hypothetical protein ABI779_14040 [Acidobacteriota bacterium]